MSNKKSGEKKAQKGCHVCKQNLPSKDPPPSGICSKCQHKIAVVILIILVILAGMVFVGLV